jgi:site-specific DNA-methyltransferase (adenine-specific)
MNNSIPIDKIICGDSASVLKEFPANSVNMVITSPPYFQQREYAGGEIGGEHSVDRYVDAMIEVFHECVRVVKEDGNIVFNLGDKYEDASLLLVPFRFALKAIQTEKVLLVNNITWVKTNPTPRQFQRRLVSSTEPFFHFAKTNKYYYNINAFQKTADKQQSLSFRNGNGNRGESYREAIGASDLSTAEKRYAYRELDEVLREIKDGDIYDFRMKIRGIHSPAFGGQAGGRATQMKKKGFTIIRMYGRKLKKDVIISAVENLKAFHHPAVYPQPIIEELIKLLTKPKDVVLDPFIGSGTSAVAAKNTGRHYIGIDINPAFVSMSEERLKKTIVL